MLEIPPAQMIGIYCTQICDCRCGGGSGHESVLAGVMLLWREDRPQFGGQCDNGIGFTAFRSGCPMDTSDDSDHATLGGTFLPLWCRYTDKMVFGSPKATTQHSGGRPTSISMSSIHHWIQGNDPFSSEV